jgi:hypothetical protein
MKLTEKMSPYTLPPRPGKDDPLTAITLTMVAARSAAIASTSGATTAKNSCRSLHALCGVAARVDRRNPAVGIEHQPDRKRDRVLSASEIAALWRLMPGTATSTPSYDCFCRAAAA